MYKLKNFFSSYNEKSIIILLLVSAGLTEVSTFIYIPSLPYLTRIFNCNEWIMQFSLILSPLLASISGMIYGNMSNRIGRRKTMLFSMIIFCLGSMICFISWEIHSFLLGRFIQAIGGGGVNVVVLIIFSDLFSGAQYARYLAAYGLIFPIVFAIAPLVGARLLTYFGWASNFLILLISSIIIIFILYFILKETININFFRNKSSWNFVFKKCLDLSKNPYFLIMTIGNSLPVAILGIYNAHSAFVFIDIFGFSPVIFSYIQLLPVTADFIGAIIYRHSISRIGLERALHVGIISLILFCIFSLVVICLANVSSSLYVLSIATILSVCLLNFGLSYNIISCATNAFEIAGEEKSTAIALVGIARNILVSFLVMFAASFYNGSIIPVFFNMFLLAAANIIVLSLRKNVRTGPQLSEGVDQLVS